MIENVPYFTVFTPTLNRAYILPKVYEALQSQTFKDFEWIIIDDGSSDDTRILVQEWIADGILNIRYFYQHNQGKHVAHNLAVEHAVGELFLVFDSDDSCVSNALERFKSLWESIPSNQRNQFSTLSVLCFGEDGTVLGREYPESPIDGITLDEQRRLRSFGDKWGINVTRVLKDFKFPVFPDEKFIAESLIWNRISQHYSARFVNEKLCRKIYRADGLTHAAVKLRVNNPSGATLVYFEELSTLTVFSEKLKSAINFVRFSLRNKSFVVPRAGSRTLLFVFIAFPAGILFFLHDTYKISKINRVR